MPKKKKALPESQAEILNAGKQFDHWKFTKNLPAPATIDLTKKSHVVLQMRESDVQMGLYDADGDPLTTTVWGYTTARSKAGNLGPTLPAEEGSPVTIHWRYFLPTDDHLLPVDDTLHMARPSRKTLEKGYIPVVSHLHSGENDAQFDGYPEAWFTQNRGKGPAEFGPFASGLRYTFDNEQQAAPLWYHDHALGLTRLNVYAGLAGVYQLTDDNERSLNAADVIPDLEVPLVIQDKAFTTDGKLYYPGFADDPLPDGNGGSGSVAEEAGNFFDDPANAGAVSALPEFFGDHIIVNGMAWPNYDVAPGPVTFNLLNGSDSRFYVLDFAAVDGNGNVDSDPDITVLAIAGDGGLLPQPVDVSGGFVLAPGDRLDVVVDFSMVADGEQIRLLNSGPAYEPFKGFLDPENVTSDQVGMPEIAAVDDPVGNIMQFTVDYDLTPEVATLETASVLNTAITPVDELVIDNTRRVGLFEGADDYGRVQPLLGTAEEGAFHDDAVTANGAFGPLDWFAEITETPTVGTTEKWEVFNFTADAHTVHLHPTQFQVLGRRQIQFKDEAGGEDGIPDDTTGDGQITYGYYAETADPADALIDFDEFDIWISETLREPAPEEGGRQDTIYVPSGPREMGVDGANIGDMLEFAARFEKEGLYVWHCHILSHEDHEMMRPLEVIPVETPIDDFLLA